MNIPACLFDRDATAVDLTFLAGKSVLIAGAGGGTDCVTAWAVGEYLKSTTTPPSRVLLANAKKRADVRDLTPLTPGGDVYRSDPTSDRFYLDTRMPLDEGETCYVIVSPQFGDPYEIRGITELGFDHVIVVDTGADVVTRVGRDWRTYQSLLACGKPVTLALVAPGSDGQETQTTLRKEVGVLTSEMKVLGHLPARELKPSILKMHEILRTYSKKRGTRSTLLIVQDAFSASADEETVVPRERHPHIPNRWLQSIWFLG